MKLALCFSGCFRRGGGVSAVARGGDAGVDGGGGGLGFLVLPVGQQEYVLGSVDSDSHSFGTREVNADIAWSYFTSNPIFGAGVGLRKQHDATNVLLFTAAETGLVGLMAFLAIHVVGGKTLYRAYRVAKPGSLVLMAAGLALALVFGRFAHGLVDHYWSRGAITAAWGMVGAAQSLTKRAKNEHQQQQSVLDGHL